MDCILVMADRKVFYQEKANEWWAIPGGLLEIQGKQIFITLDSELSDEQKKQALQYLLERLASGENTICRWDTSQSSSYEFHIDSIEGEYCCAYPEEGFWQIRAMNMVWQTNGGLIENIPGACHQIAAYDTRARKRIKTAEIIANKKYSDEELGRNPNWTIPRS